MADYLQQVKMFTDTLAAVGSPMDEEDVVLLLINGLPSVHAFSTAVRLRPQSISIVELQDLLLIEEQQLIQCSDEIGSSSNGSSLSSAFAAFTPFSDSKFNRGGRQGRARGRGRGRFGKSKLYCQLCRKAGHLAFDCYYRHDHSFQRPIPQQ